MIGLCHRCNSNEVETIPTEVLLNEIGITTVLLCDKCRRFWYSNELCDLCYFLGKNLTLIKVKDSEVGSVMIPLCKKCRE